MFLTLIWEWCATAAAFDQLARLLVEFYQLLSSKSSLWALCLDTKKTR